MKQRVISAVVLVAVCAACFPFEISRVLLIGVVGMLCAYEYLHNMKTIGIRCTEWVLYGYLAVELFLTLTHSGLMAYIAWFTIAVYLALFSGVLHREVSGRGALYTVAGLSYPCFPYALMMIISIRSRWLITFALGCLSCWTCDTFALFGGKLFGKHKLAPEVSPKKTVEGCLCGAVCSVLAGVIIYFISLRFTPIPFLPCVVTALASSTAGQIGDLAESLLKRYIGVKDFSNLIPGHGGFFDRTDSLMFSVPTAYLCLYLFGL
ncbi:MAG: phosphatidate cytidylyltransferase [Oscillospiraceae bacterium]|nr:phosphatidate cytidylyltransferase [Oscillospiraceae bacterium]